MRGFWALFRKELRSYFASPLFYVVTAVFCAVSGYYFYTDLIYFVTFGFGVSILDNFWQLLLADMVQRSLLIAVPLLTMRLFAEEKRLGTIELLYTYPLRDGEIFAAKLLGCTAVLLVMLVPTLLYPLFVHAVQPFPLRALLAGYAGLVLVSLSFVACGIFISSLTESQVVAGISTIGLLLLFWILSWNEAALSPTALAVLARLSMFDHFQRFARGVIDTRDVSYFVLFVVFFGFLTMRAMEWRKWRGRR